MKIKTRNYFVLFKAGRRQRHTVEVVIIDSQSNKIVHEAQVPTERAGLAALESYLGACAEMGVLAWGWVSHNGSVVHQRSVQKLVEVKYVVR